ncbi:MAG: amidohydrolase family protein [Alphaproteobacteria bacterium]
MSLGALALVAGLALTATPSAALDVEDPVVIIDATVHTMGAAGILETADVLIEEGIILDVGQDLDIPDGATVIGGAGRIVTPGFMTAFSSLGIEEVSAVNGTRDDRSGDNAPFSAALDVVPALNPASSLIPVTRIEGVTRAMTVTAPGETIFGGLGAVIHLGLGPDLVVQSQVAQVVALGERGGRIAGGSRPQAFAFLEEALRQSRMRQPGSFSLGAALRHEEPILSLRDLEALHPAALGAMPLAIAVNRASDIRAVLTLAAELELRIILVGASEGWLVAEDIAAAGVPVILRPSDNLPSSFEDIAARLDNAARLHAAGVTIAFTSFDTHNERLLAQQAGLAVANGLPHDAALAAVTINPARIFGIADTYGSLEPGKDADLVIWDGDPLEVTSAPVDLFIMGRRMPLTSRQTALRDRYRSLERGTLPFQYR